jgi:hypothetical protein
MTEATANMLITVTIISVIVNLVAFIAMVILIWMENIKG